MKPPGEQAIVAANRWARQFPKGVSSLRRMAFAAGYQQKSDEVGIMQMISHRPLPVEAVSQTQLPRETLEDHFFKYPSVIGRDV